MKCIISPYRCCYHNIGSEEYLMSRFTEDIFYLYVNSPCIVIGKNQNAYSEINRQYIDQNGIALVRRRSGGGAVYHDLGTLNYGFIVGNENKDINLIFKEYTAPILEVLNDLGVPAVFSGRNDLVVDEKKISGNAQFRNSEKVLQHGTLLFDSDLSAIEMALNVSPLKFEDKSTKSVRSRVTNINEYLTVDISIAEFAETIVNKVKQKYGEAEIYQLTDRDKRNISELAEKKYSTWEWNYGNTPLFKFNNIFRYKGGVVQIGINVEAGRIVQAIIHGDFFGEKPIEELLEKLIDARFDKKAIDEILVTIDVGQYIWDLDNKIFVEKMLQVE